MSKTYVFDRAVTSGGTYYSTTVVLTVTSDTELMVYWKATGGGGSVGHVGINGPVIGMKLVIGEPLA